MLICVNCAKSIIYFFFLGFPPQYGYIPGILPAANPTVPVFTAPQFGGKL